MLIALAASSAAFEPATKAFLAGSHQQQYYHTRATATVTVLRAASTPNDLSAFENETSGKGERYLSVVELDKDYRLAAATLALGACLEFLLDPTMLMGTHHLLTPLGLYLAWLTSQLQFIFQDDELTILNQNRPGETVQDIFTGVDSCWDTRSIVNYAFFPEGWIDQPMAIPLLIYIKETQTSPTMWYEGLGTYANSVDRIVSKQAVPGQVHFLPAICNARQLRNELIRRECNKLD